MKLRKYPLILLSSVILGLIICSCNHFNAPTAIWNPNQQYPPAAVISKIIPANSAIAGVRQITIIGKNFSSDVDSDWVWLGEHQAIVKNVSLGSEEDTLVIYRPPNYGNLDLKVVIPAADSIGMVPYNVENPLIPYDISSISYHYLVMEAGANDDIYIGSLGYIYKLSQDGNLSTYLDTSYFKQKVNRRSTDFANDFKDLKFGPGGYLYATFDKVAKIYQINPDSSEPVLYATLPRNGAGYFDFDENGNIYTGDRTSMYMVTPGNPPTYTGVGDYNRFIFGEIRVIKEPDGTKYVYVASSTDLYRSQINSDGTLGAKQLVVSIANDTAFANDNLSSFNVGADGTVFISITGDPNASLFVIENGKLVPYYKDKILPTGIDQLIWGTGRYLYLSRGKTGQTSQIRIYKMGIAKDDGSAVDGAPYLGRGL